MRIEADDYFAHIGTPRHSGRYPWGSGGDNDEDYTPRNSSFLMEYKDLKKQGLKEKEIATALGYESTTDLRAKVSIENNQEKAYNQALVRRLRDKGMSGNEISKRTGISEPTVRNYLKAGDDRKKDIIQETASMLRSEVNEKEWVDVGKGNENYLGIAPSKLNTALSVLKEEGYQVHTVPTPQIGRDQNTKTKVLSMPGTTQKDAWMNRDKIQVISKYSDNFGENFDGPVPPKSISPKRVRVRYKEDGGAEADGVLYVRPGVKDVELGNVNYAQVRVKVGNDHYIKGMAIYKDDLPDGVDILFNTNKTKDVPMLGPKDNTIFKPLSEDASLPFGSITRPARQIQKGGKPTSVMNIVNDEGDWGKWSKTLSSQFLSKQSPVLVKSQLDMTKERRESEYEEIKSLTNPTVRKNLLLHFADGTDAASVHLKAAALPGQTVKVLLPVSTLSPTEVYAPGYKNGDRVVLIRHPHGGTFELPELTVNNNHPESKKLIGETSRVAIGINHEVAKRLSGADFDGDTVLVVPNRGGRIKTSPPLAALKDFDPANSYPGYPGMKVMSNTQKEMGEISNLITDMTIKGASHDKIAQAVRHSMVVIDAEKHKLDHKTSYNDNGIKKLKEEYQRQPDGTGGAATLISRSKSQERVPHRRARKQSEGGPIDPVTGEKVYVPTGKTHWETGKPLTTRSTKMAEAKDARTLSSGTIIEGYYADYANHLKGMANEARRIAVNTPPAKWNPSAKATYKKEVDSLNAKLDLAKQNAPLERQAQIIANSEMRLKKQNNPQIKDDKDLLKKLETQAITGARDRTGAKKARIYLEQEEWDAIQAGAISPSKLEEILTHAIPERVRELATPRTSSMMTTTMLDRAQFMLASGFPRAEVAEALGVSVSTLDKATAEL